MAGQEGVSRGKAARTCYRVFGSPDFAGNPVALHDYGHLEDTESLSASAAASACEDNVFFRLQEGVCEVRFFSRSAELVICGHGLVALAYHLRPELSPQPLTLRCPAYTGSLRLDQGIPWVSLPVYAENAAIEVPQALCQAVETRLHVQSWSCFANDVFLARVSSLEALASFDPEEFPSQAHIKDTRPGALILGLPLSDRHYALRYFAPWHGKPEDTGTGSAQAYLAPLWVELGVEAKVEQYSPHGRAEMRVMRDRHRVWLSGHAEAFAG